MLDHKQIIRRIQSYVDRGINGEDGDVTEVRQNMFSRYMGEEYGNERDGYSKFVSREVLQAIEWALPSLLRIFMGGVKAVEFKPSGPDDVLQAKHETDVVNYWFFEGSEDGSGFLLLYSWLKDLLMYPNGYVKVSVDEKEVSDTDYYEGITSEQIDAQEEKHGADAEITRKYSGVGEDGAKVELFDIAITSSKWQKRPIIEPVAPDECIIDHNHHELDLDSSKFICHRTIKTRSDLRKLGYSEDDLADLSPDDTQLWSSEKIVQLFYIDEEPNEEDDEFNTEADERLMWHECFMELDLNEDGINEFCRVVMAGCRILEKEEVDFQGMIAASAIHVTHKHIGMGYAEIVADLQELMTTLTRQLLDNIYKQNVQRKYVSQQAILSDNSTMDQLLDGESEIIVVRGEAATAIVSEQITPIVAEIGGVMEQFKEAPQMRTGVAPQLSLDPSVLEKATMGAFVGALEQASQRLELLARLFAETGLKKAFLKLHHTLRTHFDKPQQIEIGGQWIETDPSKWKRRSNMSVNVGLGFNNKQAMLGLLTQLLAIQKEALPSGLADSAKIYATLEKLVEQANLGHSSTYFNDPKAEGFKAPPPQPDAAMILAQAQADALRAEIKRKDRELDAKIADQKEKAAEAAAKLNQALIELKAGVPLTEAQIAEIHAKITSLNRDDKHQSGPAEDSSADEFAAAAANGKGKTKPASTEAAPA